MINKFANTDAVSFLKDIDSGSIDLVFTDPPYVISRETGFHAVGKRGVKRFSLSMDFGPWDNPDEGLHNELMKSVISEYFRVLKKGGACIIWYDIYKLESLKCFMETAGFKQIRFIEWVKKNPVPLNSRVNYLTNCRETALTGVKEGKPVFNSKYDNGIYTSAIHRDGGKRLHPCQKPMNITIQIIEKHTNLGDTVLDTFAGSGTTLLAAAKCGRKFAGCEINREYYLKGLNRIKENGFLSEKP